MRVQPGSTAPDFSVTDLEGQPHSLERHHGQWLLLQFYRYSGCPMCDLRLHDFAREYPALQARGLRVLAFFHSREARLRRHLRDRALPFPVVADPLRAVYRRYGVETSLPRLLLSTLRPSFYWDWLRSMRHGYLGSFDRRMTTMPADFLIAPDGSVRIAHYGSDIGDHVPAEGLARELG